MLEWRGFVEFRKIPRSLLRGASFASREITGEIRYLMGSVSDRVVMYTPCSALVLRPT